MPESGNSRLSYFNLIRKLGYIFDFLYPVFSFVFIDSSFLIFILFHASLVLYLHRNRGWNGRKGVPCAHHPNPFSSFVSFHVPSLMWSPSPTWDHPRAKKIKHFLRTFLRFSETIVEILVDCKKLETLSKILQIWKFYLAVFNRGIWNMFTLELLLCGRVPNSNLANGTYRTLSYLQKR